MSKKKTKTRTPKPRKLAYLDKSNHLVMLYEDLGDEFNADGLVRYPRLDEPEGEK